MEAIRRQRESTKSEPLVRRSQGERTLATAASDRPLFINHAGSPMLRLGDTLDFPTAPGFTLQAKLAINEPGDQYEQEADRVAEQVMRMPHPVMRLQRKCGCGGQSGACACEDQALQVQQKAALLNTSFATAPTAVDDVLRMPGRSLDQSTRTFYESRFGHNFSQVRVHTDVAAAASARAVNALAYTVGHNVVFADGQFAPATSQGKRLIAHELAHVTQQRAGRVALQRNPAPPVPGSTVDLVIDELGRVSRIAGVGDFPAAFRILDRLSLPDLLAVLEDLEVRLHLDVLIANSGSAASFNQARLVTAMQVVRQTHGAGASIPTALATISASNLPADEQFTLNSYVRRTPLPTARRADQRAAIAPGSAAQLPTVDLAQELGFELEPGTRPAPAPPPPPPPVGGPPPPPPPAPVRVQWDGKIGAAGAAAAQATMQNELFAAYNAYLTFKRRDTLARLGRLRVPFTAPAAPVAGAPGPAPTGVVDIANQARAVLEARYSTTMDAAGPSPALISGRAPRTAAPGAQNIFDIASEADRSTLTGSADLAPGVCQWLFEHDVPGARTRGGTPYASEIRARHHYAAEDDPRGQFVWNVALAYSAASTLAPNNRRQLIDYRMAQWSEADPTGSRRGFAVQSAFDPGANRNRAELFQRWQIFKTSVHESLHLRAHPAFDAATLRRGTMKEGFTEMFTVATLADVIPRVRLGNLEPLRQTVEGSLSTPAPDARLITDRLSPAEYVQPRAQAERIRDGGTAPGGTAPHAGVGEAAVRAAYFHGHVEYLGLAPGGSQLAGLPAAGAARQVRVPGGMSGLEDLAERSGVARPIIERDNPGITDALPATAILAGCREHWVVTGETRAAIAAQNGVSEADLVRANPDISLDVVTNRWPALIAGHRLLIPVH